MFEDKSVHTKQRSPGALKVYVTGQGLFRAGEKLAVVGAGDEVRIRPQRALNAKAASIHSGRFFCFLLPLPWGRHGREGNC